jgi:serine/threonine-protein kinase SRPK3
MARRLLNTLNRTTIDTGQSSNSMGYERSRAFSALWRLQVKILSSKRRSSLSAPENSPASKDPEQVCDGPEATEDLEEYKSGGYHPVQPGERLCLDRYEIVHKLGYGSHSTVWLAKDHSRQGSLYVAIKVVQARTSFTGYEVECLQHLLDGPGEHPGKRYILPLDHIFSLQGPNGHHLCLVMPVAGCSLYNCKISRVSILKGDSARAIAARMLLGLSFIHSRQVIHGGRY